MTILMHRTEGFLERTLVRAANLTCTPRDLRPGHTCPGPYGRCQGVCVRCTLALAGSARECRDVLHKVTE